MVAIHNHRGRARWSHHTVNRMIVGVAITVLVILVMNGAGYAWHMVSTSPIAGDKIAYREAIFAVLSLGLIAIHPFIGIMLSLVRSNKRRHGSLVTYNRRAREATSSPYGTT